MSEPPVLTPNGLRLSVKQEKKRVLGVFGGGNNTKVVQIGSEEQARVSHQHVDVLTDCMHDGMPSSTLQSSLPQHPSSLSQHPSKGTSQHAPSPRKKGLFNVVGSIGSGITKIGRDVAGGVSKVATGRPPTSGPSRMRTSVTSRNTSYNSGFRQEAPPVVQPVPCTQTQPEWKNAILYVPIPLEDSTMQVFLSTLTSQYSVWASKVLY